MIEQAIYNFCNAVCDNHKLLEQFLGLKDHIDSNLFMSDDSGRIVWDCIQFAPIRNEKQIINTIKLILNLNIGEQLRNKQDVELKDTLEKIESDINRRNIEINYNNDQILSLKFGLIEMLKNSNIKTINNEEEFINNIDKVLLQGKELIKQYNNQNNYNTKKLNQLLQKYNIGFIPLANNKVMSCMKEIVNVMDQSEGLVLEKQMLEEEQNNIIKFTK